uniref:Uncharacterized protein n=1 Tax=Anguilla anguilla TaxID=7936 RepID=A0A0E9TRA5_ANGAN
MCLGVLASFEEVFQ